MSPLFWPECCVGSKVNLIIYFFNAPIFQFLVEFVDCEIAVELNTERGDWIHKRQIILMTLQIFKTE